MKLLALAAASAAMLCAQGLPINTTVPLDTVVAHADGKSITAGEIRRLLESGDPNVINLARQSPETFLDTVFVMHYLDAEAEKLHLAEQSPLKEQLQIIRERIIFNAMVNYYRDSYNVPEKDIGDFYAKNSAQYEQSWIKVIAIGFCPTVPTTAGKTREEIEEGMKNAAEVAVAAAHCTSKRTEEKAHDIAMGLVGVLRAHPADFEKLVAQYSEDPDSKATQGDFGLVTRESSFKPEIKAAVFSLGNGEVSDPIKSGKMFYIVKIKEKTIRPLAAVREPIVQQLKQNHFTEWMSDINKRFKPVIERPDFFTKTAPPKP